MKISKVTVSESQKLQYITLRELPDYIVLTLSSDMSVELGGENAVHVRQKAKTLTKRLETEGMI